MLAAALQGEAPRGTTAQLHLHQADAVGRPRLSFGQALGPCTGLGALHDAGRSAPPAAKAHAHALREARTSPPPRGLQAPGPPPPLQPPATAELALQLGKRCAGRTRRERGKRRGEGNGEGAEQARSSLAWAGEGEGQARSREPAPAWARTRGFRTGCARGPKGFLWCAQPLGVEARAPGPAKPVRTGPGQA